MEWGKDTLVQCQVDQRDIKLDTETSLPPLHVQVEGVLTIVATGSNIIVLSLYQQEQGENSEAGIKVPVWPLVGSQMSLSVPPQVQGNREVFPTVALNPGRTMLC